MQDLDVFYVGLSTGTSSNNGAMGAFHALKQRKKRKYTHCNAENLKKIVKITSKITHYPVGGTGTCRQPHIENI